MAHVPFLFSISLFGFIPHGTSDSINMNNNDCELDISPGLDSCSSSLNSTQENTPLISPLHQTTAAAAGASATDFTLEAASLILENFQLSFLESLDDQLQSPAQTGSRPSPSSAALTPTPTSSSTNSISNCHLSYRSPSSFLFDPPPIPSAPNAADPSAPAPAPISSSAFSPTALAGSISSSNVPADFFDTDVIMDRSGEEVNFLRVPQLLHPIAGAAGAPDTSNFNSSYPNYYHSQDTFAITNTYQSENEPDHDQHHHRVASGSASTNNTTPMRRQCEASSRTQKKAAAVTAAYTGAPPMHDITSTTSSNPVTGSACFPTNTTTTKRKTKRKKQKPSRSTESHNDNTGNDNSILDSSYNFSADDFFTFSSSSGAGDSGSSNTSPRLTATNFNYDDGSGSSSITNSPDDGDVPGFFTSTEDYQQSDQQQPEEPSFSLFPPIVYKQFDPRYAIPLLPDLGPPTAATAATAPTPFQ